MPDLKIDDLYFTIEQVEIVKNVNLEVQHGEFVGLIGPNGSGKSTLLKNIYKVLKPCKGTIVINNKNLLEMSNKETARELAVVAQENDNGFDFSVEDIVIIGRHPYKGLFEANTQEDMLIVDRSLDRVGMLRFKSRSFLSLSGGEKQRVLIARALVQETEFLILDEPTNHLDIGYQISIMDLIKNITITTFAAIHDLNIAAIYCDKIIFMKDGRIIRCGPPEKIMTEENLFELFGIEVEISINQRSKKLQISPVPSRYFHERRDVFYEENSCPCLQKVDC